MVGRIERLAAGLVLVLLLVATNAIGNLSTYGSGVLLLLTLPLLLSSPEMRRRMARSESVAYGAAFLLLALAFALSADTPSDVAYATNFVWFLMFIPAVALLSVHAGPRATQYFGTLTLIGSAVSAAVGYYEAEILGIGRAVGFANLTNPFAMAGVMLGFLALTGFFARKDQWRYLYLLGPIMALGTAVFTGTRGAMVMIAVLSLAAFGFWVLSFRGRQRLFALLAGLALAGLTVAVGSFSGLQGRALSAFHAIAAYFGHGEAVDLSTEIRLNFYFGGIQAFLESPIFGHGNGDQFEAARRFMSQAVNEAMPNTTHLHNDYVNFAALAGVMGLAAYGLYMLIPVFGAVRSVRDSQYMPRLYGAVVVCLCYATFGLFDTSFAMELLLGFGPICTAALLGFCVDAPAPMKE